MEGKWLLCMLLVLGTAVVQAHDGHDDDVIDIEDDLDDVIEEVEDSKPKPDTSAPPSPKVTYKAPVPTGEVYFADSFDRGTLSGWILSKAKKDDTDDEIAKYDGKWEVDEMKETKLPGDKGLVLLSRAKHHAISTKLNKPFIFDTKPLIVQYEVNFQNGIECGGAYVKLLSKTPELNLDQFHDKTPYTIMFGPDKCGEDYKLHFIFRHKNPKTGVYEEKHAKRPDADLKTYFTDKKTHLYTLILNPDNSFEILVDQAVVNSGNLLNDMTPPVNPSREIEDPEDRKPEDWDERPKIPDPDAVKPDDWDEDAPAKIPDEEATKPIGWLDDEPEYVPDPDAEKPEDWDEDMDGEWEAPQIANPKCESAPGCGVWQRPMIDNPNYKGKWKPPMIDNPNYQPGVVGQMIEAAEERPWLWVVYILTVALPVFLVILFCCSGKKQASPVEYKKTDAPQPDVKEEEEEKEEEKEKGDEEEEGEEKLEEKQKSDAEEDGGTVSQEEEDRKPKAEEDEILNRSPRNRKPRRE
uniref:Calnexin n=1 Tax=Sus scrofa TaxID=9823 RepID=A0A8W4FIB6_PIG